MEIRKNKKIIITGTSICLASGILSAACGVYWLIKALAFDETNLPAILGSFSCSLILILYSNRH